MPSALQQFQRLECLTRLVSFLYTHPIYSTSQLVIDFMSDASTSTVKQKYSKINNELSQRDEVHEPHSTFDRTIDKLRADLPKLHHHVTSCIRTFEIQIKHSLLQTNALTTLCDQFQDVNTNLVFAFESNYALTKQIATGTDRIQKSTAIQESSIKHNINSLGCLKRYADILHSMIQLITQHDQQVINLDLSTLQQRITLNQQKLLSFPVTTHEKIMVGQNRDLEELDAKKTLVVFIRLCVWEEILFFESRVGEIDLFFKRYEEGGIAFISQMNKI